MPTITGVMKELVSASKITELLTFGAVIDCDKKTLLYNDKIPKLPNKSKLYPFNYFINHLLNYHFIYSII